MKTENTGSQQV